jgi:hypothetical protein
MKKYMSIAVGVVNLFELGSSYEFREFGIDGY